MEVKEIKKVVDNLNTFIEVPDGIERLKNAVIDLAVRGLLTEQKESDGSAEDLYKEIQKDKDTDTSSKKKTKPLTQISAEEVPFSIPQNWKWVKLGDISTYIQRGKGPKYTEISKYPVLSQKCVRWHHIDWSKCKYIEEEGLDKYEEIRFLKQGDLLLNSTGTGTIGRVAVFENNPEYSKVVADSHVTVARFVNVSSRYIALWMSSEFIQYGLYNGKASGSTNQIEWNLSTILNEVAPLPPLTEQKRIVERVDELMKLIDQLEVEKKERDEVRGRMAISAFYSFGTERNDFALKHLTELVKTPSDIDELEKSILSLAVSGKLTPQDSKDGDAEKLYQDIQKKKVETGNKNTKILLPITDIDVVSNFPNSWKVVRLGEVCDFNYGKGLAKEDRKEDGKFGAYGANGVKTRTDLQNSDGPGIVIGRKGSAGAITLVEDSFYATDVTYYIPENQFGAFEMRYLFLLLKSLDLPKYAMGIKPGLNRNHAYNEICGLPPKKAQKRIITKVDELMGMVQKLREVIDK